MSLCFFTCENVPAHRSNDPRFRRSKESIPLDARCSLNEWKKNARDDLVMSIFHVVPVLMNQAMSALLQNSTNEIRPKQELNIQWSETFQ